MCCVHMGIQSMLTIQVLGERFFRRGGLTKGWVALPYFSVDVSILCSGPCSFSSLLDLSRLQNMTPGFIIGVHSVSPSVILLAFLTLIGRGELPLTSIPFHVNIGQRIIGRHS